MRNQESEVPRSVLQSFAIVRRFAASTPAAPGRCCCCCCWCCCWSSRARSAWLKALDSCSRQRSTKATSEGRAPKASSSRQRVSRLAESASAARATTQESSMPQPCMEMTVASSSPRCAGSSALSAVTAAASGYSPPTPRPRSSRQSASCRGRPKAPSASWTQALSTAPTMVRPAVVTKAHFRPTQSATKPKVNWPTMMPASMVLTMRLLLSASVTSEP
mmetsp:Transcript_43210/g.130827  ORF Transcript_43210/g.130827 Transcript_43210/m.130827 type:complete len:219 (+) Transcript_43210:22-678(+)